MATSRLRPFFTSLPVWFFLAVCVSAESFRLPTGGERSPQWTSIERLTAPAPSESWQHYARWWRGGLAGGSEATRSSAPAPAWTGVLAKHRHQASPLRFTRSKPLPGGARLPRGAFGAVHPLFQIQSTLPREQTRTIAHQLDRVYWAWSQLFFPLWRHAGEISEDRLDLRRQTPMRIVLIDDIDLYRRLLKSVANSSGSTGYYDPSTRCSYMLIEDPRGGLSPSAVHEFAHQWFAECTARTDDRSTDWVDGEDFWLIEGIAGYLESTRPVDDPHRGFVIGGWHSSRLQYARRRWANGETFRPLRELASSRRNEVQRMADLPRWYAESITWTHHLMNDDQHRRYVYQRLAQLYGISLATLQEGSIRPPAMPPRSLAAVLKVSDTLFDQDPPPPGCTDLCLAGTDATEAGLSTLTSLRQLRWIDLSGLPLHDETVGKFVAANPSLADLNLAGTAVTDGLAPSLRDLPIVELDCTQTRCGDAVVAMVARGPLQTLYATASAVTDQSIDVLLRCPTLQSVDVQATAVTDGARNRLLKRRPGINLDFRDVIRRPASVQQP